MKSLIDSILDSKDPQTAAALEKFAAANRDHLLSYLRKPPNPILEVIRNIPLQEHEQQANTKIPGL